MVEDGETRGEKNHGYTWEFFKERVESEFILKNYDYILRCKLRDLVNVTNDNLRQYVRVYFELMLEIRHMHELDRVCHFMMGLPTWAKHKFEENWPASLSEAIMKLEGFSDVGQGEKSEFKDNKFFHKKSCHEGEWNRGQVMCSQLLEGLKCDSQTENNRKAKSWGTLPNSQHLKGVEGCARAPRWD
jgi:hypothetical protein